MSTSETPSTAPASGFLAVERRERLTTIVHNLRVEGVALESVRLSATDEAVALEFEGGHAEFDSDYRQLVVRADDSATDPARAFKILRAGVAALEAFVIEPFEIIDAEFEAPAGGGALQEARHRVDVQADCIRQIATLVSYWTGGEPQAFEAVVEAVRRLEGWLGEIGAIVGGPDVVAAVRKLHDNWASADMAAEQRRARIAELEVALAEWKREVVDKAEIYRQRHVQLLELQAEVVRQRARADWFERQVRAHQSDRRQAEDERIARAAEERREP